MSMTSCDVDDNGEDAANDDVDTNDCTFINDNSYNVKLLHYHPRHGIEYSRTTMRIIVHFQVNEKQLIAPSCLNGSTNNG